MEVAEKKWRPQIDRFVKGKRVSWDLANLDPYEFRAIRALAEDAGLQHETIEGEGLTRLVLRKIPGVHRVLVGVTTEIGHSPHTGQTLYSASPARTSFPPQTPNAVHLTSSHQPGASVSRVSQHESKGVLHSVEGQERFQCGDKVEALADNSEWIPCEVNTGRLLLGK